MKDEYRDSYQQFGLNVVYYRKKKRLSQVLEIAPAKLFESHE